MNDMRLQLNIVDSSPPVVCAAGDLDYVNCEALRKVLRDAVDRECGAVTLDLSGLDFIDSTGLRVLVATALDARQDDCKFQITSLSNQLYHMLEISGFGDLFELSAAPCPPDNPLPFGEPQKRTIEFAVASTCGACREARNKVYEFAALWGLDQSILDDIRLGIGEAVSNAVRHGNGTGAIFVRCKAESGLLRMTLKYPSTTFDPDAVPVPDVAKHPNGGMGIYFISLVMDRVIYSFENGHAIVELQKHLPID